MKIIAILLMLLVLFLSATFAQEATQTILPDGAVKRFGKGFMRAALYSPDGAYLAVGSSAGIWFYDTTTYREVALLPAYPGWLCNIIFSPDGATVATTGTSDTKVRLWDVATGAQKGTLTGHTRVIVGVTFSPDGKTFASWSSDGTVRLWNTATWELEQTLVGHTDGIYSVVFSPDGRRLASSGSWDDNV